VAESDINQQIVEDVDCPLDPRSKNNSSLSNGLAFAVIEFRDTYNAGTRPADLALSNLLGICFFKALIRYTLGDTFEMKKFLMAFGLSLLSTTVFYAQATTDIKKGEVFVGYSNGQIDTGVDSGSSINDFFRDRENFNGFEVSGVYNLSRYFGVKGDFSAHFNSTRFNESFPGTTPVTVNVKNSNSLYNFLGGVQVKDNSNSGTWKPFAHALVGAAHARSE